MRSIVIGIITTSLAITGLVVAGAEGITATLPDSPFDLTGSAEDPGTCGAYDVEGCTETEHSITDGSPSDYYKHDCWEGIIHYGPTCSVSLVPLDQLLTSSPEELFDLVAMNDRVRVNWNSERVESLDCAGDHLYAAASFKTLGITAEALTE